MEAESECSRAEREKVRFHLPTRARERPSTLRLRYIRPGKSFSHWWLEETSPTCRTLYYKFVAIFEVSCLTHFRDETFNKALCRCHDNRGLSVVNFSDTIISCNLKYSVFGSRSLALSAYKYSFFPRTLLDWNTLPAEIRLKYSLSVSESADLVD